MMAFVPSRSTCMVTGTPNMALSSVSVYASGGFAYCACKSEAEKPVRNSKPAHHNSNDRFVIIASFPREKRTRMAHFSFARLEVYQKKQNIPAGSKHHIWQE